MPNLIFTDAMQFLLSVIVAGLAWWMATTWKAVRELDKELTAVRLNLSSNYATAVENRGVTDRLFKQGDKIHSLELFLAQQYITREEANKHYDALNERLDEIYKEVKK